MTNEVLRDELLKDEKILWEGQPERSVVFSGADVALIPFSIFWCLFIVFWLFKVVTLSAWPEEAYVVVIFFAFGIPFLAVGFYLLVGRFFWSDFKKSHTYYFVTNLRVIIVKNLFQRNVQAQFIDRIPCMNKAVRKDGIGTIRFGNAPQGYVTYSTDLMDFWRVSGGQDTATFYDVRDVEKVYAIVNSVRKG